MHKLLLADDSVTIQRVIELTFADEDVEVRTAGDGEQAIASIQAEPPDIVLADIGMPKRSGYDVAAFIKGAPELAHIPVLLLTGAFEPVDEHRARAAGCDGVLVKPFEPQHVIARVRELLQGVEGAGAPDAAARAVAHVPRPAERFAPGRPQPVRPAAGANGGTARPPQPGSRPSNDLDDYFDRLDAAFANMANTAEASAPQPPDTTARREGPVMERDLDWFDAPSTPAAPLHHPPPAEQHGSTPSGAVPGEAAPGPEFAATPAPVTFANPPNVPSWAAPQAPSIEPAETPASLAPAPGHPALVSQGAAGGGSAIADAFSALLAAEQGDADAPPFGFLAPQRPVATDELVEQVARRVLERLSDQSFRELITDVVSRVAERVVREEIERIRSKYS